MFIKHTKCCVKVLVFSDSKLRACEAYNDKDNTQKMKHNFEESKFHGNCM